MMSKKGLLNSVSPSSDAKKMARDVHAAIIQICQTEGGMTPSEAELYVKKMINQKRYSSDVWS